jgi:hypothetical protein
MINCVRDTKMKIEDTEFKAVVTVVFEHSNNMSNISPCISEQCLGTTFAPIIDSMRRFKVLLLLTDIHINPRHHPYLIFLILSLQSLDALSRAQAIQLETVATKRMEDGGTLMAVRVVHPAAVTATCAGAIESVDPLSE